MRPVYNAKPGRDMGDGAFERWCERNRHVECAMGSCRRPAIEGERYCTGHNAVPAVRATDVQPRERFERV